MIRLHRGLALAALAVSFATPLRAQAVQQSGAADPVKKKPLSIDDYARWRTIEGAQLSGDGKYAAYVLRLTNVPQADTKPVMHLLSLDNNQDVTVADASNPQFSPDSKWVVYQIDPAARAGGRGGRGGGGGAQPATPPVTQPDSAAGRGGRGGPPAPQRRTELRELATGKVSQWNDITSAVFAQSSTHLLLRRGAGAGAGGGGRGGAGGPPPAAAPGAAPAPNNGVETATPRGTDAILVDLASGHGLFLGSVGDASFNKRGDLFAYTVDATQRDGNGLFIIDLKSGTTHVVDNDAKAYNRMTWNDEGSAIAVLKGKETPRMRERENTVVVYPNIRATFGAGPEPVPVTLEATVSNFPKGFVISDRGNLSFSDDSKKVFFGMIPQTNAPDSARRRSPDSVADVDVWRAVDDQVQSVQMARADQERNFTFREGFDLSSGKFVLLTDSTMKDIEISGDGKWGVGRDTRAFISDYEPARADLYRVNLATGERTPIVKGTFIRQMTFGITPNSKHYIFWKDAKFQDYDLDAGTTKTLGNAATPSFVDLQFDHPGPKPAYGVFGYTKDGNGVIVEHRYDVWLLPLDGTAPRVLTEGLGSKQEIKFTPVRSDAIDPTAPRADRDPRLFDLSKPITMAAYAEWTKKAGFYELASGKMRELVWEDAAFSNPVKAAHADKYMLTRQTFAEFPDLRISGYGFKDSKKISDANPQQSEFLWGHQILFDYKLKDGQRAQGILAIPDDYKQGEKRPMIVSFYEKNSQNENRYRAPSFVTGMGSLPMEGVTRGYLMMFADVYYRTGQSHSDQLEAVEAATKKVIELGYADPAKIGLNGHSYGGEGAGFIATRSRLFKAVGVGAGVTDLATDFVQSWGWSYQNQPGTGGANGIDYYIYGQGRWGFSPWDKPDVFHFESSLTHAPETTAAVLIMHGTADPTVSFNEGLKFYTALRYNKKDATLLAYVGEPHGLRGLANRRDLTIRYFQFFDAYLKGTPKPEWLSKGVPFLVKDAVGVKTPQ